MALFKVSGKNLKRVLEDKMKEPFTDLIIQLSANDISNLQFLDDQDLRESQFFILQIIIKNTEFG